MNVSDYLQDNCFVYVQGNEADIEKYYDLVRLSKDDKMILYPERSFRLIDSLSYRPYVKSVITENPWIISSYSRDRVWIIRDGEWQNPSQQTYGASVNMIMCSILNSSSTIPLNIIGGQEEIDSYLEKVRCNNFK